MLTAEFVADVRRQASLTAQTTDADVLATADAEVRAHFMPLLRAMRAEYGVRRLVVPIANGRARIPDRAQVAGIRLVQWMQGGQLYPLQQVTPEEDVGATGGTQPWGFYFDAGDLCLVPSQSQGQVLIRYYQRAPRMVLSSSVAVTSEITNVTVGASVILNYSLSTIVANGDVVSAAPDHRTVVPGIVTGTGAAAFPAAVFDSVDRDIPVGALDPQRTITAGDWVAPNGSTPFVPLPEELSAALMHRTAGVLLRSLGYLNESAAALELAREAEAAARPLLAPRSEGNPRYLTSSIAARMSPWRW